MWLKADCDKALKQIKDLPLDTPLTQASYFFDGIRNQLPEFDEILLLHAMKSIW